MSTNLYVGNLTFQTDKSDLELLFGQFGEVSDAHIITDRETGRSRGFAFVEMASPDAAQKAISSLNEKDHQGRPLTVNIAKPRNSR